MSQPSSEDEVWSMTDEELAAFFAKMDQEDPRRIVSEESLLEAADTIIVEQRGEPKPPKKPFTIYYDLIAMQDMTQPLLKESTVVEMFPRAASAYIDLFGVEYLLSFAVPNTDREGRGERNSSSPDVGSETSIASFLHREDKKVATAFANSAWKGSIEDQERVSQHHNFLAIPLDEELESSVAEVNTQYHEENDDSVGREAPAMWMLSTSGGNDATPLLASKRHLKKRREKRNNKRNRISSVSDILKHILLYVPAERATICALGLTCKQWHFYQNYMPQWRVFLLEMRCPSEINEPNFVQSAIKDRIMKPNALLRSGRLRDVYFVSIAETYALEKQVQYGRDSVMTRQLLGLPELAWFQRVPHKRPLLECLHCTNCKLATELVVCFPCHYGEQYMFPQRLSKKWGSDFYFSGGCCLCFAVHGCIPGPGCWAFAHRRKYLLPSRDDSCCALFWCPLCVMYRDYQELGWMNRPYFGLYDADEMHLPPTVLHAD